MTTDIERQSDEYPALESGRQLYRHACGFQCREAYKWSPGGRQQSTTRLRQCSVGGMVASAKDVRSEAGVGTATRTIGATSRKATGGCMHLYLLITPI